MLRFELAPVTNQGTEILLPTHISHTDLAVELQIAVEETPTKFPISRKWAAWGRLKDRFSAADYLKTKATHQPHRLRALSNQAP